MYAKIYHKNKTKNNGQRLVKKILIFIIIIVMIIFYNSDSLLFRSVDSIDSKIYRKLHISFIRNQFIKFVDAFNPYIGNLSLDSENLPILDLILTKKASDGLQAAIENSFNDLNYKGWPYMSSENNSWQKTKIIYKKQSYNTKVRIHGTDSIHYRNDKKSLAFKFKKNHLLDNMRRFSLLVINEASISSIFSYRLINLLTKFKVNSYLVKLRINGINQGVFVLEEKLSKELLEKNGMSGMDILRPNDEWDTQYQATHETPFNWNLANTKMKEISKKELGQLLTYDKLYKSNNIKIIKAKLDLNRLSESESMRVIFNKQVVGDNQKLLYDTSTGKFFRYFRSENTIREITRNKNHRVVFDPDLYGVNKLYKNTLFIKLIQDNKFRLLRNKKLWEFVQKSEEMNNLYMETFLANKSSILADPNHYSNGKVLIHDDMKKIKVFGENIDKIKQYLDFYKIKVEVTKNSNNSVLKFTNSGNTPLRVKDSNSSFDFVIQAEIDKNLNPIESVLTILVDKIPSQVYVTNIVTGERYVEAL
jgi:hypothetical protein